MGVHRRQKASGFKVPRYNDQQTVKQLNNPVCARPWLFFRIKFVKETSIDIIQDSIVFVSFAFDACKDTMICTIL